MRIGLNLIWILLAYRFGNWRSWRVYYPTFLFWLSGCLIYQIIFHNWSLWIIQDTVLKSHVAATLLMCFISFFCVTIIYIPKYPEKKQYRVLYIISWSIMYTTLEFILSLTGNFSYDHGWNIWFSLLFNLFQFSMLILHHKNHQLAAWGISLAVLVTIAFCFGLPLKTLE